ncbi:Endoplasmic reticulum mannosyl-oligosaccharide 1,2-alpha-mannosidase, partial [Tyrophagus putrescentiae]
EEEENSSSFNLDFCFFRTPAFIGALLLFTSLFIVLSAVLLWLQIFSSSSSNSSKLKFTFCTSRHLNSEQQLLCRQAFVRNMTLEAFHAYKRYAWGAAELAPISKAPSNTRLRAYPGLTIVDAMSTLWLMDLKEEWAEGLHWIKRSMPPYSSSSLNRTLRVKEAVVDALGGLLSAYALSSEPVLLEKAMEVYLMLDHSEAFNRNTSFLAFKINPARGREVYNKLASVGFEQPELVWLAQLTRNRRLQRRLAQIRSRLAGIGGQTSGFYPSMLELGNGTATKDSVVSLSEDSKDFYYNMVRALMQRGEGGGKWR